MTQCEFDPPFGPKDDRHFWYEQARKNATEIAHLREALKQERLVRMSYRQLLDCYEVALKAFMEIDT